MGEGGEEHEPKKFQVTWFIKKKKIMVDKKLHLLNKYLSREEEDEEEEKKKRVLELQILGNMFILSH